jgi:hypothetical protein
VQVKILKTTDANPLDFVLADTEDGRKLAATLVKLLKTVSDPTVQAYALTHIEDILSEYLPTVSTSRHAGCRKMTASWHTGEI